jgi:hypothetical protein
VPRSKSWAALAAALSVALLTSLAGPTTEARADRCNPDEMLGPVYTMVTGKPYVPVFGHDDGPFCYAMKNAVYPAIGCDPVYQSLVQCLQTQPGRAMTLTTGVCRETISEIVQAYFDAAPYAVEVTLAPILDFFSKELPC